MLSHTEVKQRHSTEVRKKSFSPVLSVYHVTLVEDHRKSRRIDSSYFQSTRNSFGKKKSKTIAILKTEQLDESG